MKRVVVLVGLLALAAAPASAQQTPADVISFLVVNQSVQTGDFQKDQAAAAATRDTIARALLVNLATVPIETSSSGFVYRLDPELGTVTRSSDSFGTFFVERAMTSGRGRASFGTSGTTTGYDRLDGLNLRDGTLITTANQFRDESAPFDTEALTMKIRTNTLTFFGAYGVTDRLEIGGALPFVQLRIEGSRLNVYRGDSFVQASGTASASGVADAAVRAKYRLVSSRNAGFAAAAELRLPTGDETALLGAGRAAIRLMAIGSVENARVGAHANFAVVRGGVSNEVDGSGAVTYAATPRLTVAAELLLRRLGDIRQMVAVSAAHPTISGVDTLRLVPGTASTTLSNAVTGIKWNVAATMVITAEVRWRLANAGLTAPFTPTIALDYLF
jgi:outer membrane putative beta-barrel porin/alpha-amylase